MNYSLAFILTRYQYNILLATLNKLNIHKEDVVLIVAKKAQKQNVTGLGFKKVLYYNTTNESLGFWRSNYLKIKKILKEIDFIPENIFLRNFNAGISRVLLSKYSNSTLYLLEEGMPSYMRWHFMGYSTSLKENLKIISIRFFFSKGKLRVFPINLKKTIKAGLFKNMKECLDIPYLPIVLDKKIFSESNLINMQEYKVDVLILDQPLWQIGITDDEYFNMLLEVIKYVKSMKVNNIRIGIKLHPATDKIKIEKKLLGLGTIDSIQLYDSNINIEELLLFDKLKNVKLFIGFFSWALCFLQAHKQNDNIKVICLRSKKLDSIVSEAYLVMKKIGITIIDK